MNSIVSTARSTLRRWRRHERRVGHAVDALHDALGRAVVRATRSVRLALRESGDASAHGIAAATVSASAAVVELAAGGLAAPVVAVAADLATLGIAVHAVSVVRRRGRVAISTGALFERSVRHTVSPRGARAARIALGYAALRDGSLDLDADAVRAWAGRVFVASALGAVAGAIPGVGSAVRGLGPIAAIARNYAFVRAVEIEAQRLVAAECARVPIPQPALRDLGFTFGPEEFALAA